MTNSKITLLFFAMLVFQGLANAQWQSVFKPTRPFATATFPGYTTGQDFFIQDFDGNIRQTLNGGQSFEPLPTDGLPEGYSILAVYPYPDYCLALGFPDISHLYRLPTGSQTWEVLDAPVTDYEFGSLHRQGEKLVALTYDLDFAPKTFRSDDGGITWAPAEAGLPAGYYPEYFEGYDSVLVTASFYQGSFFSTDAGLSWHPVVNVPVDCPTANIHSRAGYSLLGVDTCYQAVYSADGGMTWKLASGLPGTGWYGQLIQTNGYLFARVENFDDPTAPAFYRSDDQGATWTVVQSLNSAYDDMGDIAATDNGTLLFFAKPELYISLDTGTSWTQVLDAPNFAFSSLRAVGTNVYLVGDGGLFASDDDGLTWTDQSDAVPKAGYDMSVVSANGPNLFASDGNSCNYYRSTDGGQNWAQGSLCYSRYFLETPQGVFAASLAFDQTTPGIQFSTDHGATWAPPSGWTFGTTPVSFLLEAGGKMFAAGGGFGQGNIFASPDGGITWTESSNGIPDGQNEFEALAYDPATGKLYATGRNVADLFVSTDLGENWTSAGPYGGASVGAKDSCVYIWLNGKVYLTHDDGITWQTIEDPIMAGTFASHNTLVLYGDNILVGSTNGVFRSPDRGITWELYNDGLSLVEAYAADLIRDDEFLYVASRNNGIFRRPLNELTSTRPEASTIQLDVYPNPSSNGVFVLESSKTKGQPYQITVTDIHGQDLLHGTMTDEQLTVDLSNAPAGVFWLRLISEEGTAVRRLVKTGK